MDKDIDKQKKEIIGLYNKKIKKCMIRTLCGATLGSLIAFSGFFLPNGMNKYVDLPTVIEYNEMKSSLQSLKDAQKDIFILDLKYKPEEVKLALEKINEKNFIQVKDLDNIIKTYNRHIQETEKSEEIKEYIKDKEKSGAFPIGLLSGLCILLGSTAYGHFRGSKFIGQKYRELETLKN